MAKNVVGVLGGNYTSSRILTGWLSEADYIIGADSGAHRIRELGFLPHVVLGDLDSIHLDSLEFFQNSPTVDVVEIRHQDITDCGKLLSFAEQKGINKLLLTSTEGDLMDHQLDAIHTAVKSPLDITFGLERGIGAILKGEVSKEFQVKEGCRVSLIPITEAKCVQLTGVKWALENTTLSPTGSTSISNIATSEVVRVSIASGAVYLFIEGITSFSQLP
jgi:thiamine pyrophosphokinase